MAYGDPNDFGWCNLVVKFLLFVTNVVVWLLGVALLGAGVYVLTAPETNLDNVDVDNFLTAPAILLCIIGGVLLWAFDIEFHSQYTGILSVLVLLEIAVVVYVYLQRDSALSAFRTTLREGIEQYYDDPDKASIVDQLQSQLIGCCGVEDPNDWQANPYFNCSSQAAQRCSVPYSCCVLEEDEVIDVQCGYRALDPLDRNYYRRPNATNEIYSVGCRQAAEDLFNDNLEIILGVGVGLLIFQLFNIMLAGGMHHH
ncbi:Tetraspanin-15 [Geodia barretti]|uniref:Tetraspanin n=1 Tax=Geodia barretti TaxID=519541 RepID=A0AA35WAP5_GEOBA|nr:Tetraspanin-15 [Geodia barretti]